MAVVYEEIEKLHHTIEPIVTIQTHSKERVAMLKEAVTTLDKIHEWSKKHPKAPVVVPKKDWIALQNTRVQLRIKVQSREKLAKDAERALASYRQLFSSLESVIQLHGSPSIGEIGQLRNQEEINNEVQAFIETYRQVTHTGDMPISRENIKCYIIEPVRLYTKLGALNNHIHVKRTTLLLDALEFLHQHDEGKASHRSLPSQQNTTYGVLT